MMDKYAVTVCSFSQSKRVLYNSQNVHQLACVPVCAGVRACVRPGLVLYIGPVVSGAQVLTERAEAGRLWEERRGSGLLRLQ